MVRPAQSHPESAETIIRGIKFVDDRIANPAYGLLLVTGLLEVYLGGYGIGTSWIDIALVLYVVLAVVAAAIYSPTLKKQIAVVASSGVTSPEAIQLASRGRFVGISLGVLAIAIVFVMVVKPTSSLRNKRATIFAISGSTLRNRSRVACGHGETGSLAPMCARIASAKYSSIPEAA